jgi:hypothetical protein
VWVGSVSSSSLFRAMLGHHSCGRTVSVESIDMVGLVELRKIKYLGTDVVIYESSGMIVVIEQMRRSMAASSKINS